MDNNPHNAPSKERETFFKYKKRFPNYNYVAQEFLDLRNKVRSEVKIARKLFYNNKLQSSMLDGKTFWTYISEILYNKTVSAITVEQIVTEGLTITDPIAIAEHFNKYLTSTRSESELPELNETYLDNLNYSIVTPQLNLSGR